MKKYSLLLLLVPLSIFSQKIKKGKFVEKIDNIQNIIERRGGYEIHTYQYNTATGISGTGYCTAIEYWKIKWENKFKYKLEYEKSDKTCYDIVKGETKDNSTDLFRIKKRTVNVAIDSVSKTSYYFTKTLSDGKVVKGEAKKL